MVAHGRDVLRQGVVEEVLPVGDRDALVDRVVAAARAVRGVAVAGVVLGRREHAIVVGQVPGRALEAVDRGLHLRHQAGVLPEALVGAAPAVVARRADAGREAHCGPEARVSSAVMCSTSPTRFGSRVAPRPMLCGNTVAPSMFPSPCTLSIPSRASARNCAPVVIYPTGALGETRLSEVADLGQAQRVPDGSRKPQSMP